MLGALKNLLRAARNVPNVLKILPKIATNPSETVSIIATTSVMSDEKFMEMLVENERINGELQSTMPSGKIEPFDRQIYINAAIEEKKKQLEPSIMTALTPTTTLFGFPAPLVSLTKYLSGADSEIVLTTDDTVPEPDPTIDSPTINQSNESINMLRQDLQIQIDGIKRSIQNNSTGTSNTTNPTPPGTGSTPTSTGGGGPARRDDDSFTDRDE